MYFRGKMKIRLILLLFSCVILNLTACNDSTLNNQANHTQQSETQNGVEISVTEAIVDPAESSVPEEAEDESTDTFKEISAAELALFGQDAYNYLEYFQKNLNARTVATEAEKNAADYLVSELKDAGYADAQIEVQNFHYYSGNGSIDSQNIIVTKKGTDDKVIVVGAHYDSIYTHGIEDNASGVSVVLENAVRLADAALPYTTKFIFFGAEEAGLLGSANYVNSLSEDELGNIGLMINLDCIMTGDKAYLFGGAVEKDGTVVDSWAVEQAKAMAEKLGLETYLRPNRGVYKNPSPVAGNGSDHASFKNKGIPYVYFTSGNFDLPPYDSSVTNEVLAEIIHTPNDDLDILYDALGEHMEEMLKTYSILLYHMLLNIEIIN